MMHRLSVARTATITSKFTREDWEIFDMPGVDRVVADLNYQLQYYTGLGFTKEQVRKYMHQDMWEYRDFGAADTEPRVFLEDVLDEIFGDGV